MAGEFPIDWLGNLIELDTGFAFKSADFSIEGVKLARGDNVKRGQFEWGEKAKFWPAVTPELARYQLDVGDVLIGMDGSRVGENWVRVSEGDLPALLVQRVARLRAKPGNDQDFIWYLIANGRFVRYIKGVATGTSIPHISGTQIKSFEVPAPPFSVQRQISAVLRSIDEKIDLNRQMAATLEEMARALFKSWFVDFEPVHAKAEGLDPGLPADIAALFPDSLDDEGLPVGWTSGTPESFVEINPTTRIDRAAEAPYVDMAALPTKGPRITSVSSRPVGSGSRFKNGDTLLARITPCLENGKTAFVDCLANDEVAWGSTEFIVMRPKEGVPAPLPYLIARDAAFRAHVIASMSGTSGRQRAPAGAVGRWSMTVPTDAVISAWGNAVLPMFDRIRANSLEADKLTELRDTLLPKLISGELQLPDAEVVIAAA